MVIEVLLACYNGEKYLPEQLESLSAQARQLERKYAPGTDSS